jgi:hypothetical protein
MKTIFLTVVVFLSLATNLLAESLNYQEILNGIYYNESRLGRDKSITSPRPVTGELGAFQIRPATFKLLKNIYKPKYDNFNHSDLAHNTELSRSMALDYCLYNYKQLKKKDFNPTTEMILASYNAGHGIYKTNTKVGVQVQKYIDSATQYIKRRANRERP